MFWGSRQSLELISHLVKFLIHPALNDIDISLCFPVKRYETSVDTATLPLLLCIKAWLSRRNIPLIHLCETWQTGSFPRLHSFDELFKSQSRDSFCLVTVKTCHWKWGVLSQTVFALFYRFSMALSKGFRMPPFNYVHVLSETVN